MSSSGRENEVGRRSPFGDDVLEEGVLEVDEREVDESASPVPFFAPDLSVAEREGVECVRRVLEQLSGETMESAELAVERDDDDDDGHDSYVDMVGNEETDEGAVSEVSLSLRLSCERICCQRLCWRGCRFIRNAIVLVFTLHPH